MHNASPELESVITYISHVFGLAALVASAACSHGALAQSATYNITAAEKTACVADAARLCMSTYPDEQKLLGCMAANRESLTKSCLVVFDAGLKRRRIVIR